jgi:hypothetical protein
LAFIDNLLLSTTRLELSARAPAGKAADVKCARGTDERSQDRLGAKSAFYQQNYLYSRVRLVTHAEER